MGLLSWFKGTTTTDTNQQQQLALSPPSSKSIPTEVPGMNGAVEVPRPPPEDVTVFEFGSVAVTMDKVTLAGFCPVSDDLEPCRWEILPATDDNAPQFRVVF